MNSSSCMKKQQVGEIQRRVCDKKVSVRLLLNVPVNNCSVMSGRYYGMLKLSCPMTLHDGCTYRTQDISLISFNQVSEKSIVLTFPPRITV